MEGHPDRSRTTRPQAPSPARSAPDADSDRPRRRLGRGQLSARVLGSRRRHGLSTCRRLPRDPQGSPGPSEDIRARRGRDRESRRGLRAPRGRVHHGRRREPRGQPRAGPSSGRESGRLHRIPASGARPLRSGSRAPPTDSVLC